MLGVAAGGVVMAGAAALLPALVYLRPPPVVSTAAGLVVLGAGLAVLALTGTRVGWLVVLAGYAWYLPDLAITHLDPVDGALARTAFLYLGLLVHAVATSRDDIRRLPVALAVVDGLADDRVRVHRRLPHPPPARRLPAPRRHRHRSLS